MSIIKELGGYEYAKQSSCAWLYKYGLNWKKSKERDLLKYRREYNIYEVGDYVVYKSNAGLDGLFQIETMTKTGKPKTVKTKRFGNFPCRYCEVKHATDAEIKQGCRELFQLKF